MKVHSDIILFEILNLYFEATDTVKIEKEKLKKGFYTLLLIINDKNNLDIRYNFETELKEYIDRFSDYLEDDGEEITLIGTLDELFNATINSHSRLKEIDYECQDYIFDIRIYNALDLKIPIEEMEHYFKLNQNIIRAYLKLGENELQSFFSEQQINHLRDLVEQFNEEMNDADNSTLIKLKMCYKFIDKNLFPDIDEDHIDTDWNIILFSSKPKRLYSITHSRIKYLTEIIDKKSDEESEETLNNFFSDVQDENPKLSLLSYFLTIVFIELSNLIKNNPNSEAKEALLIKKYLLLSVPELSHIEKYYFETMNLDYPEPPIPEELSTDSFEDIKDIVFDCVSNLVANNDLLESSYILARVITSAIFIKVFIGISINENSINDIMNLIENSLFYKKPYYEKVTKIVDEIIFSDNPQLRI